MLCYAFFRLQYPFHEEKPAEDFPEQMTEREMNSRDSHKETAHSMTEKETERKRDDLYGDVFRPKAFYGGLIGQGHGRASECVGCGQCESVCPQHLPIIDLLKSASEKLDA